MVDVRFRKSPNSWRQTGPPKPAKKSLVFNVRRLDTKDAEVNGNQIVRTTRTGIATGLAFVEEVGEARCNSLMNGSAVFYEGGFNSSGFLRQEVRCAHV